VVHCTYSGGLYSYSCCSCSCVCWHVFHLVEISYVLNKASLIVVFSVVDVPLVISPVCVAMNCVGRRFQGLVFFCDNVFYNGDSQRSKYKFRTVECTEVEKLLRPARPPPCLFFPSYLLSEHVTVCRKAASWNFLTPLYL
jgi:hypothetical protein